MNIQGITHERLVALLAYDADTGIFTRKESRGRSKAGAIAGYKDNKGYIAIKIDNKIYLAHRLAWLYMNKAWPTISIDHINQVRDDNRIQNLREVSRSENQQNRGMSKITTLASKVFRGIRNQTSGKHRYTFKVRGNTLVCSTHLRKLALPTKLRQKSFTLTVQ